jgi:anti-anti-sigma regulatory factor
MKARSRRSTAAKTTRRKPVATRKDTGSRTRAKAAVVAVATAKATAAAEATVATKATDGATVPVTQDFVAAVDAPVSADAFFLTLPADCTLRESADLQFSLMVANGNPLVVDGSEVQRVDTAGAQLLVALAQRQRNADRRLEWKGASQELLGCGQRLGLLDVLGLAALAAGVTP